MRHLVVLVTATAMLFGSPIPTHAAARLSDIVDHWARTQVEAGVAAGYIHGYPDGLFRPDGTITRAEFFKMLAGSMRITPEFNQEPAFKDISHWLFLNGHGQAAVSEGLIVPGEYGDSFGPDDPITRREIAMASVRALGRAATLWDNPPPLTASDKDATAAWLQPWAATVVQEGIMKGYPDGSLGLRRTATRAEALVMVQRILAKLEARVEQASIPKAENVKRYPAAGEPFWTWTYTGSVKADGVARALPSGAEDVRIEPAPGGAAWLTYQDPATRDGVVVRFAGAQATTVVRELGSQFSPVAVDSTGRFWFKKWGQLRVAEPGGDVRAISGVDVSYALARVGRQGSLLVLASDSLYSVTPTGEVQVLKKGILSIDTGAAFEGEGGTLWFIVRGEKGATDAIQSVPGKPDRRIRLTGRHATVISLVGNTAWLQSGDALYRFDVRTGVLARSVPPQRVMGPVTPQAGPDGLAHVKDGQGGVWRIGE